MPCHIPPSSARIVELIHVSSMRGDGSQENPERSIELYFSKEGELLACYDPLNGLPDSFVVDVVRA